MYTAEQQLENLVRHIELVRDACLLLGKRIMSRGEKEFGRLLIARGCNHDQSKFYGIEWDWLHKGPDVSYEEKGLNYAINQHVRTNDHHPEYWGGIDNMPRIALAEMVCDWYARSQEFGTGLRDWITDNAVDRYELIARGRLDLINEFVDLLLESSFSK